MNDIYSEKWRIGKWPIDFNIDSLHPISENRIEIEDWYETIEVESNPIKIKLGSGSIQY